MEYTTPRPYLNEVIFGSLPMENDVFAAQFGTYMTETVQTIKEEQPSTSPDWSRHSSPTSSMDEVKPAQKTKRANRYKDCSESAQNRRREQNRTNQRAYRKRREQLIIELQGQLDELNQKNEALACSCSLLSKECARLRTQALSPSPPTAPWGSSCSNTGVQDAGVAALAAVYARIEAALSPSMGSL